MTASSEVLDSAEPGTTTHSELSPHPQRGRSVPILVAHVAVDAYAAIVPALLGVLEVRCELSPEQTAWLLGIGSLSSGVSQPVFAWLSDRFNTRAFGALGLVMGAVSLCCIGRADSLATLLPLYLVGMVGIGMFHPVAASSMGQLSHRRRSANVSAFFVAGMAGGVIGSLLAPRLTAGHGGFEILRWMMVPGLVSAVGLQLAIGRMHHRHTGPQATLMPPDEIGKRWATVAVLFVAAVLRFIVDLALMYLYVRWAQARIQATAVGMSADEVAKLAAPYAGDFIAAMVAGMAIGGVLSGVFVRQGLEKMPMIIVPIIFSPVILLFPMVSLQAGGVLCFLAGIGFATMIPTSIALAQRLLPHRTNLASGLLMGGAWSVATVGPRMAEFIVSHFGLPTAFIATATLLATSGLVAIPVSNRLLKSSAVLP